MPTLTMPRPATRSGYARSRRAVPKTFNPPSAAAISEAAIDRAFCNALTNQSLADAWFPGDEDL
jgi:hypothetical protein